MHPHRGQEDVLQVRVEEQELGGGAGQGGHTLQAQVAHWEPATGGQFRSSIRREDAETKGVTDEEVEAGADGEAGAGAGAGAGSYLELVLRVR